MFSELARMIGERRMVLFAGAGLSVPLDLPNWNGLIRQMAEELGYDPDVLVRPGANYLQIAEFYKLEKTTIGPLRSWMDRNWTVSDEKVLNSRVHNQIVDLDFPLIYTTNYDRNIERIFELRERKFSKIMSVIDVAKASPDETHIVKFHGDFEDDDSLVLTEADYFERLQFESPLDIKFRSDVIGRGILFIGYSLDDLNLRLLLYRLHKMWTNTRYAKQRPESYIFLLKPDPVQQRVLESRGIKTIVSEATNPSDALPEFFDNLLLKIRAFSAHVGSYPQLVK